jgi:O6-methylguanine-DNA--protein-cysteine methyltransferase
MNERGYAVFRTPLGWAGVAVSGKGVTQVVLPARDRRAVERELAGAVHASRGSQALLNRVVKLLGRYFAGKAVTIDLPIDLGAATPFQRSVWKAAASIPRGVTRSYAWVAGRAGSPRAARAVGQAMGANPVPVIVP